MAPGYQRSPKSRKHLILRPMYGKPTPEYSDPDICSPSLRINSSVRIILQVLFSCSLCLVNSPACLHTSISTLWRLHSKKTEHIGHCTSSKQNRGISSTFYFTDGAKQFLHHQRISRNKSLNQRFDEQKKTSFTHRFGYLNHNSIQHTSTSQTFAASRNCLHSKRMS